MVHSCKKRNCPHKGKKRTMKGGSCGCNKSSPSIFGGKKRRSVKRRRRVTGGSAGLTQLSSSAYYPQNNYANDPSDPSRQIAGRFSEVPSVSHHRGGGKKRTMRYRYPRKPRKMHGGLAFSDFNNTIMNSAGINNTANILLGANVVNPPSFLQNATSVASNNGYAGYTPQNPYLV